MSQADQNGDAKDSNMSLEQRLRSKLDPGDDLVPEHVSFFGNLTL